LGKYSPNLVTLFLVMLCELLCSQTIVTGTKNEGPSERGPMINDEEEKYLCIIIGFWGFAAFADARTEHRSAVRVSAEDLDSPDLRPEKQDVQGSML
jgi:hypothetical protein